MSGRPTTEHEYSAALFKYLDGLNLAGNDVYIAPTIDKLVKRSKRGNLPYEIAHKALKRAVKQMAERWKLENYMSIPLSKAARERVWNAIAASAMEIYFIRRKQATGEGIPRRP